MAALAVRQNPPGASQHPEPLVKSHCSLQVRQQKFQERSRIVFKLPRIARSVAVENQQTGVIMSNDPRNEMERASQQKKIVVILGPE